MTMKKYVATGFFTLAIFVSIGFVTPTFAQTTDFAAQIQALLDQIKTLQAQIAQLQGQPTSASACLSLSYSLSADLTDARTNGEVTKLQQFLAQDPSIYPAGLITGYFGPMTEAAVQRWQARNGVVSSGSPDTTGYGYVGPRTRAAMACGGSADSTVTNTTPTNSQITPYATPKSSVLTSDQIKVTSPGNTTVSIGATVKITYIVGSNIVSGNPAIIERSIVNAKTDAMDSGYVPVTQSSGAYSFDWIPNQSGTYQAVLKINLNNTQYTARSGVITVVGEPISSTNLLTPVINVSASPSSVKVGQSSLLSWSSTNANRCVLKFGSSEENVSVKGTKTITPSQTTTYLVWCVNDSGTGKDGPAAGDIMTVSVSAATPSTPTVSFQASPATVGAVQSSVLSWSTSNANRCVLQYGSNEENVAINGSKTVSPSSATSYRLWCVNDPGTGKDGPSSEKTISVAVTTPSCTLLTNKSSYQLGESVTVLWASQNATYTTFQQDTSGKDNIFRPYGEKMDINGSYTTTATVYGNPSVAMSVYNYYKNSSCSITIPVN